MILREIECEKKSCGLKYKEQFENQGFPNWGHVAGIVGIDKNKNELTITLCPKCLEEVKKWLGQT
jgi:hypothetical protein